MAKVVIARNELTWQSNQSVTEIASLTLAMTFKRKSFRVHNYLIQYSSNQSKAKYC